MKNLSKLIYSLIAILCFQACSDEPEKPVDPVQPPVDIADRAVLVYMVADNNLSGYAADDIDEMKDGMQASNVPDNCRWIVYYSGPDHKPQLIEIGRDGNKSVIRQYDNTDLSVTVTRMQTVISDFKRLSPARNYGIVLWSHGTGWISESGTVTETFSSENDMLLPLSFGYDGYAGKRMKITSLAKALSGDKFDFIYFDCCHMASVEVAYELRDATDNLVASTTELGVKGMPYDSNVPLLLKGRYDLAADNTFNFYNRYYETVDQYGNPDVSSYGCSISTLYLPPIDALAKATRNVLAFNTVLPDGYKAVPHYRKDVVPNGSMFDFDHYIRALCGDNTELYTSWRNQFDLVVRNHKTTPRVFTLNAADFSGLSTNIISSQEEFDRDGDKNGYRETAWWADVVSTVFN